MFSNQISLGAFTAQVESPLCPGLWYELAPTYHPGPVVVDLVRHLVVLISAAILQHPGTPLPIGGLVSHGLMHQK